MNPWGSTWREKNKFEEYFVEIVLSVRNEDFEYAKQLMEELTPDQGWDIWYKLGSTTRRLMKENKCVRLEV